MVEKLGLPYPLTSNPFIPTFLNSSTYSDFKFIQ
jgi:hypothetical protein